MLKADGIFFYLYIYSGGWKEWIPGWMCGRGIKNSVVGIIGCGNIGTSIAEKLINFKVSQLLYSSRSEKPAGKYLQFISTAFAFCACEDYNR